MRSWFFVESVNTDFVDFSAKVVSHVVHDAIAFYTTGLKSLNFMKFNSW